MKEVRKRKNAGAIDSRAVFSPGVLPALDVREHDCKRRGSVLSLGRRAEKLRKHERPPVDARLMKRCVREDPVELLREGQVVGPLRGPVRHEGEGDVVVEHAGARDRDRGREEVLVPLRHVADHPVLGEAVGQLARAVAPVHLRSVVCAADSGVRHPSASRDRLALAAGDLVLDPLRVLVHVVTEAIQPRKPLRRTLRTRVAPRVS
eukprot:COSAG06_NODE_1821_length_8290_cov_33.022586_10_plen_206_part_00